MINISIEDSIKILIAERNTDEQILTEVCNTKIIPQLENRNVDIERMITTVLTKIIQHEKIKEF